LIFALEIALLDGPAHTARVITLGSEPAGDARRDPGVVLFAARMALQLHLGAGEDSDSIAARDPTLVHGLLALAPHPGIALALIELSVHPGMNVDFELAFVVTLVRVAISAHVCVRRHVIVVVELEPAAAQLALRPPRINRGPRRLEIGDPV